MEDPREQPDYEAVIQAFLSWIKRMYCPEIIDPDAQSPVMRVFVPINEIEEYFEKDNQKKLKQIIDVLFPNGDGIFPNDVLPNYIKVFCTLLHISKGKWMKHFRRHATLSDSALPFDPASPPSKWPIDTEDPEFLRKFCDAQWKFCTPEMGQPFIDRHFESDRILPITFKETLKTGGSAAVSLITVHPSYNKLIKEDEKKKLDENANTFVLKTYFTSDAEKYYNTEVGAFRVIGQNSSIIGFRGSFTRGDTYNMLLEYADKGTLEDFFRTEDPPTDGEEIIQFWQALFQIIDALRRIHEVKSDGTGGPRVFQGWHQDVKPENILVVSNGSEHTHDWQFKLADLGISHFERKDAMRQDSDSSDTHGTRTYGAPECYRPDEISAHDRRRVGQNVDIWSLGCIFSEAARWLKYSYKGIGSYRQERRDETSRIPGFRDADCFHDGEQVLRAVHESHKKSIKSLRDEDFITRAVVANMIPDMLDTAKARPTASQLWLKSLRIIKEAQAELELCKPSSPKGRALKSGRTKTGVSKPPPPPVVPPGFIPSTRATLPTTQASFANSWVTSSNSIQGGLLEDEGLRQTLSPDAMTEVGEVVEPSLSIRQRQDLSDSRHSPMGRSMFPTVHSDGNLQRQLDLEGESPTENWFRHQIPHNGTQVQSQGLPRGGPAVESLDASRQHLNSAFDGNGTYMEGMVNQIPRNNDESSVARTPSYGKSGIARSRSNRRSISLDRQPTTYTHAHQESMPESMHRRNDSGNFLSSPTSLSPSAQLSHRHSSSSARSESHSQSSPQTVVSSVVQYPSPSAHAPATPPPTWSIQDALKWKKERKDTNSHKPIPHSDLHDRLKCRDHVFLIDDSESMSGHWGEVTDVFEALSYILKYVDPDGLDLSFTVSGESLKNYKVTSTLVQSVRDRKSRLKGTTDMNLKLTTLLENYQAALEKPPREVKSLFRRKPVRPLNLYILTDGIWEAKCDAEGPIRRLIKKLADLGKGRIQVGIEFISFGNNIAGLQRMDHLDSGLDLQPDIVDHEPSTGNVWKMLLGSTNDTFDEVDEDKRQGVMAHDFMEVPTHSSQNCR